MTCVHGSMGVNASRCVCDAEYYSWVDGCSLEQKFLVGADAVAVVGTVFRLCAAALMLMALSRIAQEFLAAKPRQGRWGRVGIFTLILIQAGLRFIGVVCGMVDLEAVTCTSNHDHAIIQYCAVLAALSCHGFTLLLFERLLKAIAHPFETVKFTPMQKSGALAAVLCVPAVLGRILVDDENSPESLLLFIAVYGLAAIQLVWLIVAFLKIRRPLLAALMAVESTAVGTVSPEMLRSVRQYTRWFPLPAAILLLSTVTSVVLLTRIGESDTYELRVRELRTYFFGMFVLPRICEHSTMLLALSSIKRPTGGNSGKTSVTPASRTISHSFKIRQRPDPPHSLI